MRLSSYLAKSRHGIYHVRLYVPKRLQSVFKTTEIRRSLGTRDPREARDAAYRLAPIIRSLWRTCVDIENDGLENLRKRFGEAFDALERAGLLGRIRIELDRGRAFEFDTKEEGDVLADWLRNNSPATLEELSDISELEEVARNASQTPAAPRPVVKRRRVNTPTYGDLIDAAFTEKSVEYKNPRSGQDFRQKAEAFAAFIGDMPISDISSEDFSRFKQDLIRKGAKAQTVNKYVQGVGIVFTYAIKLRHFVGEPPTARQRAKVDKTPSHEPFQPSHIKTFFSPERMREIADPAEYWFPLIGLHSGMRVAEIGQLRLADIYEKDGVWVIDINEIADDSSLKTVASKRIIPIPRVLVDAGFLDYVDDVRSLGVDRLFPWLALTKQGYGANVSKTFSRRLETLGIKTDALTFHSPRSTANERLAGDGVDEAKRAAMLGHDHDTTNTKTYHGSVSLAILARDVAPLLRFDIDYAAIRRQSGEFLPFLRNPPKVRKPKKPESQSKNFVPRK